MRESRDVSSLLTRIPSWPGRFEIEVGVASPLYTARAGPLRLQTLFFAQILPSSLDQPVDQPPASETSVASLTMAEAEARPSVDRENLFTKKQEKVFFKQAEEEAAAQGQKAVLLKGFDNQEKNMLIDERAYKIKQATREHTIIVRLASTFAHSSSVFACRNVSLMCVACVAPRCAGRLASTCRWYCFCLC